MCTWYSSEIVKTQQRHHTGSRRVEGADFMRTYNTYQVLRSGINLFNCCSYRLPVTSLGNTLACSNY